MNMVKWIVLGLGGVVFLIAVIFSIMLVLEPAPEPAPKKVSTKTLAAGSSEGASNEEVNNLLATIEKYQKEIAKKDSIIDSLSQVASHYPALQNELEKLKVQLKSNTDKKSRAKEISKTLTSMKAKVIALNVIPTCLKQKRTLHMAI